MTTLASSLLDFILDLLRDPAAAEEFQADPEQALASAGLGDDVEIQLYALRGQATECLITAAAHAEMLVVGTRGAGGFKGLRFGSTATQVVRHSSVPVLVVPNTPS